MRRGGLRGWSGWVGGPVALLVAFGTPARAQPPEPPPPPAPTTVEQLAERVRALETMNQRLSTELERMTRTTDPRSTAAAEPPASRPARPGAQPGDETPVPDYLEGVFEPYPPLTRLDGVTKPGRVPLTATFGPGFLLRSDDERFGLQIHYESQVEARVWSPGDQLPANSGLFLPRQRFFFNGNITRWVEYELAINRGLGGINLLNAFLNFHFDDRLEVRVGRFFTPVLYEQYAVSNYWLLAPERSLFTTNLSLNRQVGAMAWGYLFDKRLDYAVGVFNGSRNSFESTNNGVDVVGYLNARPFQQSQALEFARNLNVGTSVGYGRQDQAPVPATFRVGAGSPDANIPSAATVPFLILNPGVAERGDRVIGSVHAAYFYKGLSLLGEWQYGFGGYAARNSAGSVSVPFSGFYVAGGYFLTGEEVLRRTRVKPLRPVFPTADDQTRGWGAWEAVARVSQLRIGEAIFTSGAADPTLWSNSAVTTEVGANWYLNEYLKVYAFWLHGRFGDPVQYRPGRLRQTADMFWLRCQLYF